MKVYKHKRTHVRLIAFIFASIILVVAVILFYNMYIEEKVEELSDRNTRQMVEYNADFFREKFEADTHLLETVAPLLPVSDNLRYVDFDSEEYQALSLSFDYIMIIDPEGYAIGSDSAVVDDLSGREYFQKAMNGETTVSKPIVSAFDNTATVIIATPMIIDGDTVGVIAGFIYLTTLDEMFGDSIEGMTANLILDSEGNIIANGEKTDGFKPMTNFYYSLDKKGDINSPEAEQLQNDITFGIPGETLIELDGEMYRLIYTSVGVKDWMILSVIPQSVISSTTEDIYIVTAIVSIINVIVVGFFGMIINSSQRKNLEKISEIAYISDLTQINTIAKFKLDAVPFTRVNSGKSFLLIQFDIENFRLVNETLGTDEGDKVLVNMAKAMNYGEPSSCLYAHLHNDEFVILVAYSNENLIKYWRDEYVERLYKNLGESFSYKLKIIAGYYYINHFEGAKLDSYLEKVNIAHRRAKSTNSLLSVYSDELLSDAVKNKEIENRMESALANDEFIMVLQPELGLTSGKMVAAEALVRWQSPDGPMRPDEFIPLFEQNGFIIKLDMYMFEQACIYLANWIESGREPFTISVNFSRNHLYSIDFEKKLLRKCEEYNVKPEYLGVEITESSMLNSEDELSELMNRLQSNGFKVLMDDFGSGYSSLGLLKNTPVDILKLDRSFFTNSENRERGFAVVRNVIRLSKDLKIVTIAEGVETLEDLNRLKDVGCDVIQGYYYAKPMSKEAFKKFYDSDASKI